MADIELVIKMPEEVYKSIINGKNYISYQEYVEEAIKNGTPLEENKSVIDKIYNEIAEHYARSNYESEKYGRTMTGLKIALDVIDKYTAESEDKENANRD